MADGKALAQRPPTGGADDLMLLPLPSGVREPCVAVGTVVLSILVEDVLLPLLLLLRAARRAES